jgi:putative ABC transport system permease protein
VVLIPTKQNLIAWEFDSFKEQVLAHSQIESITGLSKVIGSEKQEQYRYVPQGDGESQDDLNLVLHVTHDVAETFDLTIIAGRSFSKEFQTDAEDAVLINRRMLSKLGIEDPQDALGEVFYFYPKEGGQEDFQVIGVLEDFNYTSLKKEVEPVILSLVEGTTPFLGFIESTAIEISSGNPQSALDHIEKVWNKVNPIEPFEYQFLDDRLAEIYEAEQTMSSLSVAFSILCILIACLGLLGLASYSAQLKKKEIGIRKSLGASITDIVTLLSKDFLKLILIANLIAWPLSYFVISSWLESFTYRFDMVTNLPIIFLGSAALMMILAIITVGYHALKAALINPVTAIRND